MSVPGRTPSPDDPRVAAARKAAEDEARHRAADPAYRRARERAVRWEDITAWPLFILSLVFLAVSVWYFDLNRRDHTLDLVLSVAIVVLWLVFIADYLVRLAIAPAKLPFVKRRWFELIAIVIPYLRPFVIVSFLWRLPLFKRSEGAVRTRFVLAVIAFALVFVITGASGVYLAEQSDGRRNIKNFGDAVWWAFTTITTVGYGDYTPVTFLGRVIAVLMMVGGVVVVGVTSAVVVSVLLDQMERLGYRVTAQIVADRDGQETVQLDPAGTDAQPGTDASAAPAGASTIAGPGPST